MRVLAVPSPLLLCVCCTVCVLLLCGSSTTPSVGGRTFAYAHSTTRNTSLTFPTLFEISTRPYLYSLSQKLGKPVMLKDIPDSELQELASRGVQIVWFMGTWKLGKAGLEHDRTDPNLLKSYSVVLPGYTQADIIGSPYAIVEYVTNPDIGSDDDVRHLRSRLHALGMLLMLDFVPNHSAVDSPLMDSNVEDYVRAPKGTQPPFDPNRYLPNGVAYGRDPYSGAWTDTAQFNYWNEATRQERLGDLMKAASLADAVRCDMAMLVLNDVIQQTWGPNLASWGYTRPESEFWGWALLQVKSKYGTLIMGECYWGLERKLQSLGFDYTYDKDLYDHLTNGNLDNLRGFITGNSVDYFTHSAHFVSNHDQDRAVVNFGSVARADAAAAVSFTIPGMKFNWQGQWEGYKYKLDVHLRRERFQDPVVEAVDFYDHLLAALDHPVFQQGDWYYLTPQSSDSSWRLLSWRWALKDEDKRLVVVNYSDSTGAGAVVLDNAVARNGNDTIPVTDLMTGQVYPRSAAEMRSKGLFCVLHAWQVQIFQY